jgi:hypothetical protein
VPVPARGCRSCAPELKDELLLLEELEELEELEPEDELELPEWCAEPAEDELAPPPFGCA